MTIQPHIPNIETSQRLLLSLRRHRLGIDEVNLQLEEISCKFEQEVRDKKLKRICSALAGLKSIDN